MPLNFSRYYSLSSRAKAISKLSCYCSWRVSSLYNVKPHQVECDYIRNEVLGKDIPCLFINPMEKRKCDMNMIKVAFVPCDCYENDKSPDECPVHFLSPNKTIALDKIPELIFPLEKGILDDIAERVLTTTHYARRSAAVTIARLCFDKGIDPKLANAQFGWSRYSTMINEYGRDWLSHLECTVILQKGMEVVLECQRELLAVANYEANKRRKLIENVVDPATLHLKLQNGLKEVNALEDRYKGVVNFEQKKVNLVLPNDIGAMDSKERTMSKVGHRIREDNQTIGLVLEEEVIEKVNVYKDINPEVVKGFTKFGIPKKIWEIAVESMLLAREEAKKLSDGALFNQIHDLMTAVKIKLIDTNPPEISFMGEIRKDIGNEFTDRIKAANWKRKLDGAKSRVQKMIALKDYPGAYDKDIKVPLMIEGYYNPAQYLKLLVTVGWITLEDFDMLDDRQSKLAFQVIEEMEDKDNREKTIGNMVTDFRKEKVPEEIL